MPACTNSFENDIINYFLRNQTVTQPTTAYLALSTTTPAEDGTGFTEPSGNGYSRQALSWTSPTTGTSNTSATVTFGPATASWGTITHIGIFFVSTGGDLKMYKNISTRTVDNGDTLQWASGDLTALFD